MMEFQSVYGSSECPNCGKIHHAILATNHEAVPPPRITISCQCETPVISVDLFYSGPAAARIQRNLKYYDAERVKGFNP